MYLIWFFYLINCMQRNCVQYVYEMQMQNPCPGRGDGELAAPQDV